MNLFMLRIVQQFRIISSTFRRGVGSFSGIFARVVDGRLLPKNIKIRIYSTIMLPVVLYVCET
jgi:hypothetical protein